MNNKTIIISLVLTAVSFNIAAQTPDNKDARLMNYRILEAIEEYTRTSTLYDISYQHDFLKLFGDVKSACIYNDLMNSPLYQKMVSPEDYVRQYTPGEDMMLETDVANLRYAGPYEFRNGKWYRKITVQKTIKIIDSRYYFDGAGGILYDSAQLYPDEPYFNLEIELVYDPASDKAMINAVDIALSKPKTPVDKDRYSVVIKSNTKYDQRVLSNGKALVFNDFDEAFAEYNTYGLNDEDVRIVSTEVASCELYNVLQLKFVPKHFRLKTHTSFAPFGAYDIQTSDGINAKSSAMEFGMDIGYTFSVGSAKMGPFIGLAASLSKIALSKYNFSYAYPGSITDHSGLLYTRNYTIDSAEEGLSFTDLLIPVYWGAEHNIGKRLRLTWDIGAKVYIDMNLKTSEYTVSGKSYATYSDGNTVADSQSNGLGAFNQAYTKFLVPVDYTREPYEISAFADLGFDVKFSADWSANISFGYEYGLTWAYQSSMSKYFDADEGILPFVYSVSETTDIPVRSFFDCISYRRQGLWINVGFKYKF